MGSKRKKMANKSTSRSKASEPSYWMIVAVIALVFSAGLSIKVVFFPGKDLVNTSRVYQTAPRGDDEFEGQIQLVASEFKCACGGCGELPLVECDCNMPQGALEAKAFIRAKLEEGLSVESVIRLVDELYGHRVV